jgi:hypothetical protein
MAAFCPGVFAGVGLNDDGGMKFSFDTLPFLGGSGSECDESQGRNIDSSEPKEYTYDATGRKVPVRTD